MEMFVSSTFQVSGPAASNTSKNSTLVDVLVRMSLRTTVADRPFRSLASRCTRADLADVQRHQLRSIRRGAWCGQQEVLIHHVLVRRRVFKRNCGGRILLGVG